MAMDDQRIEAMLADAVGRSEAPSDAALVSLARRERFRRRARAGWMATTAAVMIAVGVVMMRPGTPPAVAPLASAESPRLVCASLGRLAVANSLGGDDGIIGLSDLELCDDVGVGWVSRAPALGR